MTGTVTEYLPYILGALGGGGLWLGWEGFRRITDKEKPDAERRKGWYTLNGGIALIAVSAWLLVTYT